MSNIDVSYHFLSISSLIILFLCIRPHRYNPISSSSLRVAPCVTLPSSSLLFSTPLFLIQLSFTPSPSTFISFLFITLYSTSFIFSPIHQLHFSDSFCSRFFLKFFLLFFDFFYHHLLYSSLSSTIIFITHFLFTSAGLKQTARRVPSSLLPSTTLPLSPTTSTEGGCTAWPWIRSPPTLWRPLKVRAVSERGSNLLID